MGTLLPDADGRPDEASPIASAAYLLEPNGVESWNEELFNLILTAGRYWLVLSASTPDSSSAIAFGVAGEDLFSRRGSDGAEFNHGPLAFRITGEITSIPEPVTGFLLLTGLLGLAMQGRQVRRAR